MDITITIAEQTEQLCGCGFTQDHITEANLLCVAPTQQRASEEAVVYTATISETEQVESSDVTAYIDQWVSSGPVLNVAGEDLSVDPTCSLEMNQFSIPQCVPKVEPTTTPTELPTDEPDTGTDTVTIAIAAVAAVLLILLVVGVVAVLALVILRKRSEKYELDYSING